MGGANAQDPQGWKTPWGLWGVGLRLKEQKGPRRAPQPWSQRAGDLTWEPSGLPGCPVGFLDSSGQGKCHLLLRGGPSHLPLLISPASLLCPQGPTWPRGGLGRQGIGLGTQKAPQPECARRSPSAPLPLFPESPSCLPLLISLASGVLILSGLHFSSPFSPPTSYRFTLGFPPVSLGIRVPYQRLAGALVVGRR